MFNGIDLISNAAPKNNRHKKMIANSREKGRS